MKIAKKYSHLNGEEWLHYHEPDTFQELLDTIRTIDADGFRTKVSKEKRTMDHRFYNPKELIPTRKDDRALAFWHAKLNVADAAPCDSGVPATHCAPHGNAAFGDIAGALHRALCRHAVEPCGAGCGRYAA